MQFDGDRRKRRCLLGVIRHVKPQPRAQGSKGRLGHVHELDSRTPSPLLPYNLAGEAYVDALPGQCKLEIELAGRRQPLAKINRHTLFRQVDEGGFFAVAAGIVEHGLSMYGSAGRAATLFAHQGARGTQATEGSLVG